MSQILNANEINQINQINQSNQVSKIDILDQTQPYVGASDKYSVITTRDILNVFSKKGFQYEKMWEQQYRKKHREGFGKHAVRIFHPDIKLGNGLDKELVLQFYLWNSFDRTVKLLLTGGYKVFACSNMLVVGADLFDPIKIVHKYVDYDMLNQQIDNAVAQADKMKNYILNLKEVNLTDDQKIQYAQNMAMMRVQLSNKDAFKVENFEVLLKAHREEHNTNSAWHVANTVQENLLSRENSAQLNFKSKTIINDVEEVKTHSTRQLKNEMIRNKLNLAIFPMLNEVVDQDKTLDIQQAA